MNSLDLIAHQIASFVEQIEEHQRAISQIRIKIRELRWQAVETDEGDITQYDDVA
jgi:hypothetical protein